MESRGKVEGHSHCADRAQVQDFSCGGGGRGQRERKGNAEWPYGGGKKGGGERG